MSEQIADKSNPVPVVEDASGPVVRDTPVLVDDTTVVTNDPIPKKKKKNLPRLQRGIKTTPEPARSTPAIYVQDPNGKPIKTPTVITANNNTEL